MEAITAKAIGGKFEGKLRSLQRGLAARGLHPTLKLQSHPVQDVCLLFVLHMAMGDGKWGLLHANRQRQGNQEMARVLGQPAHHVELNGQTEITRLWQEGWHLTI